MKSLLDGLANETLLARPIEADPVVFVHQFSDPRDQELVGLVCASFAFGNIRAAQNKIRSLLSTLLEGQQTLHHALDASTLEEAKSSLRTFKHRLYTGDDVAQMLTRARILQKQHRTLGRLFIKLYQDHDENLQRTLAAFCRQLRGDPPHSRGLQHLLADPTKGSSCKRWLLYLRWMIRPKDGIDLGLWDLPTSTLMIPLDAHVFRISQNLGLTQRRTPSWKASSEITNALKQLDKDDPVRYDFSICHLGVSRNCPSRVNDKSCQQCRLKAVCTRKSRCI